MPAAPIAPAMIAGHCTGPASASSALVAMSAQAEQGQHGHDADDQANQIDQTVHGTSPNGRPCNAACLPLVPKWRSGGLEGNVCRRETLVQQEITAREPTCRPPTFWPAIMS